MSENKFFEFVINLKSFPFFPSQYFLHGFEYVSKKKCTKMCLKHATEAPLDVIYLFVFIFYAVQNK